MYREVKADAFNGRQNGLKIILDAEQFNYADQNNDAAGFQIAMHHHQDKPMLQFSSQLLHTGIRYRPKFFDQVGHQTTCASMGNKHFFTKACHRHTYQMYE